MNAATPSTVFSLKTGRLRFHVPGRMIHAMRRFNAMALDADAETLTRDDIDERMFLLRRHDLTARRWLRLLSDGNILVHDDAWGTLRGRVASRLLTLVGFYSRPRMPFAERYDMAGRIRSNGSVPWPRP